jgi:YD repeat-containing protein
VKQSIFRRALKALAAAGLGLCVSFSASAQQGGTTRYVYDDNGRLHAVIAPSGEAVVYEYDATGNITAVRRVAADALAVFAFTPHAGIYGDRVTFIGSGFGRAAGRVVPRTSSARRAPR